MARRYLNPPERDSEEDAVSSSDARLATKIQPIASMKMA
jgi:hypothetical protein